MEELKVCAWCDIPLEIRKKYKFEFDRYLQKFGEENFGKYSFTICKLMTNTLKKRIEKNEKLKNVENAKEYYCRKRKELFYSELAIHTISIMLTKEMYERLVLK